MDLFLDRLAGDAYSGGIAGTRKCPTQPPRRLCAAYVRKNPYPGKTPACSAPSAGRHRRPRERGGRQTVCSARCRARRWREAQAGQFAEREQKVRALLLTAQESLEAAVAKLNGGDL